MIIEGDVEALYSLTKGLLLDWFAQESPQGRRLSAMQSLADALDALTISLRCLGVGRSKRTSKKVGDANLEGVAGEGGGGKASLLIVSA